MFVHCTQAPRLPLAVNSHSGVSGKLSPHAASPPSAGPPVTVAVIAAAEVPAAEGAWLRGLPDRNARWLGGQGDDLAGAGLVLPVPGEGGDLEAGDFSPTSHAGDSRRLAHLPAKLPPGRYVLEDEAVAVLKHPEPRPAHCRQPRPARPRRTARRPTYSWPAVRRADAGSGAAAGGQTS